MLRACRLAGLALLLGTLAIPGAHAQSPARDAGLPVPDLRVVPHHSVITHPPGGVGANVGQAYFDVTNSGREPRVLAAIEAQFIQQRTPEARPVRRGLRLLGLAFGFGTATPQRTLALAPGQSAILAVHFTPVAVYQHGTDSFSVRTRLTADGSPFEIQTGIEVQRTQPIR